MADTPDRPEQLERPLAGRMVAGVAAGLAEYLSLDVSLVRILFVILTFFSGTGIVIYLISWLLIPEQGSSHSHLERFRDDRSQN